MSSNVSTLRITSLDRLHEEYGDFVRTGPNELTIFAPDIFSTIYEGLSNKVKKPAWYDIASPFIGLTNVRDFKAHATQRRTWDNALTLVTYQNNIRACAQRLEELIDQNGSDCVTVNDYFCWSSFDVMGYIAFSRSFDMLSKKQLHPAARMIRSGMSLLGPFSPAPWLIRLGFEMPLHPAARSLHRLLSWCSTQMDERILQEPQTRDISSELIKEFQRSSSAHRDRFSLCGNALSTIVAGSDTIGTTLVYMFYRLAKHQEHTRKIQEELEVSASTHDFAVLQKLQHLNGVINEVLRLHPAAPTGGLRETPREGAFICGRFISGNVTICAPRYTIGRLESCFERANDFVPERWYSKPNMVKNKGAFAPFASGRFGCVGKSLALMELRYVTALLVSRYDVGFAPGKSGHRVEDDMIDQFTAGPGVLNLVFTRRGRISPDYSDWTP
ncbi:hypothetical protein ACLMJK_006346 [Lecanora helva]